jgi:hypothetical protein
VKSTNHPKCNGVLRSGAPHIPDLPVRVGFDSEDESMPTVASYWKPTDEELQDLIEGGSVEVVVLGRTHPPISVRTT